MGRHAAGDAPEADCLVERALREIGAEIDACRLNGLRGVVLGGGYARGEGGVAADGSLSNDLDFYVVVENSATANEVSAISAKLGGISRRWSAALGIDVDFCEPKTTWRLHNDQERLMIQELVHAWCDVAGESGESLFAGVKRLAPDELPPVEAARLLANRGAGLLLAAETADLAFVARNLNKAVLGAGDASLIATHRYAWRAEDRAAKLRDPLYSKALDWKFRPSATPVCDAATARQTWLAAAANFLASPSAASGPLARRSLFNAARWLVRRRSAGPEPIVSLGLDPTLRVLRGIYSAVAANAPFSPSLRRDWQVFN